MAFKSPELKAAPHSLCDWVELNALSSPSGRFRLASLARLWDISRESEGSDPEGRYRPEEDTDLEGVSGGDSDAFIDSLITEIGERAEALQDCYPFKLAQGGMTLEVLGPPNVGGYIYLFCLLLTNSNNKDILDGEWAPEVDNSVRDLFQACSTVAAAAHVKGCAISFGWPRPNSNPPFLARLQTAYASFGEGRVVKKPRPGVSPSPKDEEIDVIAWTPSRDKAPGTTYLLGQVASGNNWMAKSVKGPPIDGFHRNWFEPAPPSPPIASMFIPHSIPPVDLRGTRRERLDVLVATYGIIFDRLRLPRLTNDGIALAKDSALQLIIERLGDLHKIETWVNIQLINLHNSRHKHA